MKQGFFLAPAGHRVGLTSVCLGLVHALDREGIRTTFFKPIAQLFGGDTGPERSTHLIRHMTTLNPPDPISMQEADDLINHGRMNDLMECIVEMYHNAVEEADVVIIEGLHAEGAEEHALHLNREITSTLNADLILVGGARGAAFGDLNEQLEQAAHFYRETLGHHVLGAIINFINAPRDSSGRIRPDLHIESETDTWTVEDFKSRCPVFTTQKFKLIGGIPWQPDLIKPRTQDISETLDATIINKGELQQRRVNRVYACARSIDHITHVFQAEALLLMPVDRIDLFIGACMAAVNGVRLAGIILTSGTELPDHVRDLCRNALQTGLPVLAVPTDTYSTATRIPTLNLEIPVDDRERVQSAMEYMASQLDVGWLRERLQVQPEIRFSPAAFKYFLTQKARTAGKRIVLPEGDEPRTIRAAALCQQRGIAHCLLLGRPSSIQAAAEANGIELPDGLELLDPRPLRSQVIDKLVELRAHKGLSRNMAASQLEDNVMLGTMMLKTGQVDGLVSGAVHTTANTVKPALQLIKTRPDARLVSSVFFMCLPEQVVLYGDCAINPDPTAQELADIAIQSADTAAAFDLPVRVAMISYSTGESGTGADVDKVREATRIAQERRPELVLDGPLQYDAAAIESVARSKAPDSPVAGRATVFIFPDLNTGNTTYKAVQRSASVVSIGPMLQGLNAPVNDLSRGALVEDIVYTIAITAIQAADTIEPSEEA